MLTSDTFYSDDERELQRTHGTEKLANTVFDAVIRDEIEEPHVPFIESRDFFFLSTVNAAGEPTVSYKGGSPGVLSVLDPKTVIFPAYDGNGMFKSMGNIQSSGKVGILLIDFETPHRVRIQGNAKLSFDDPEIARYPGASMIARVEVTSCWINCARYIHKHKRVEPSPYVPAKDGSQPFPSWKRLDIMQDVLPEKDQGKTESEGGVITMDDYFEKLIAGES